MVYISYYRLLKQSAVGCLGVYLIGFFISFNPFEYSSSDSVEFLGSGRLPVVGPDVRGGVALICKPNGANFLWSRSYSGNEWIFVFYRPLIVVWAHLHGFELVDSL